MKRRWLGLLLALCVLCGALPAARAEAAEWTVLIYMCGTDLESDSGEATDDIREMLASGACGSGRLRVLVATGGASGWQRYGISAKEVQYYELRGGALQLLRSAGRASMGSARTLSSFLRFGLDGAPAGRTMLILWDHGGGPVYGVCNDENYGDDALSLDELREALADGLGGARLDVLAFDACLMNSIDVCALAADFADYTVASQEMVTGEGFDYDAWLAPLGAQPSMDAASLSKLIAGTYVADSGSGRFAESATMSVIRSDAMPAVTGAANAFGAALLPVLTGNRSAVMRVRNALTSFGEFADGDSSDLLDISTMCDAFSALLPDESAALKRAAASAVVYNETTRDLAGQANGLSIFMPYSTVREERAEILGEYENRQGGYAEMVTAMASGASSGGYTMSAIDQIVNSFYCSDGYSEPTGSFCSIWDGYFGDYCSAGDVCQLSGGSIWDGLSASSGIWGGLSASGSIWGGLTPVQTAAPGGIWGGMPSASPAPGSIWDGAPTAHPASTQPAEAASEAVLGGIWAGLLSADEAYYQPDEPNDNVLPGVSEAVAPDELVAAAQAYFSASELTTQSVYSLQLTREDLDHLASASGVLFRRDGDALVRLGDIGQTTIDWSTGLVFSMFDGSWPMLAGEMARAELLYVQQDGDARFAIPAKVNGLRMYLLAARDADGVGRILGATQGYDENGFAIRGSIPLEAGMTVVPLYAAVGPDGDGREYEGPEITVPADGLKLEWDALPEGEYEYCFGLTDLSGNVQYTKTVTLKA